MSRKPTYTDDQLRLAVASACSWRDTMRRLGLKATSASAIRSVRGRADALGVSHDHFTGQRRWTETQLRAAVMTSETWDEVASHLNVHGNAARVIVKGSAIRLGLDIAHLLPKAAVSDPSVPTPAPSPDHLRRAGPMLAAAWFTMCGCDVSWPLEPSTYDLLVSWNDQVQRIQVKTTTRSSGTSWAVSVTRTSRHESPYDPDDLDWFFIIDGALNCYLIPAAVLGGRYLIHLSAYEHYRVEGLSHENWARHPPR